MTWTLFLLPCYLYLAYFILNLFFFADFCHSFINYCCMFFIFKKLKYAYVF